MNLGSVLATLAATYDVAETTPVVVKVSKPRTVRDSGAVSAPRSPSDNKPAPLVMVLPDKGSLDAEGFILAMRNAGKRKTEEGRPYFDPREVRNDQIVAIAGYCGYDNRESFASQELRAMSAAKLALKPQPIGQQVAPYSRNGSTASLKGYVAGMPNERKRRLADLQGRELEAVDMREEYIRKSRDCSLSAEERKRNAAFAAIEHRRIDAIRKDIATF